VASQARAKRILYVVWGFPPYRESGVWNPLAAVNALASRGHDVTVLCADTQVFDLVRGADWRLTARIDPAVRVVRAPQPPSIRDTVLNRWPEARIRAPRAWVDVTRKIESSIHPEPVGDGWYPSWLPPALAAARRLQAAAPFDLVVANIVPAVAAGVALGLNASAGVPLVLVERDSWVFSPFTGEPYPDAEDSRPRLEEIYRRAVQVWYVNRPLADLHRREFAPWAQKIREVRNGWDPEFLTHRIDPPPRPRPGGLVFRFVGQMLSGFPWQFIQEAWALARMASPLVAESRLELVGQASWAGKWDESGGITLAGWTPKDALADLYAATDVLVFIKEGGGMATSGKIYEYLATGLPIASSMPPVYDPRGLLAGRPLWFDAPEHTPAGLADALARAAEHAPTSDETARAHDHAQAFRRDRVLARAFGGLEEELGW
jgi:glycosyltransferase involved in cell wall biosynthesis